MWTCAARDCRRQPLDRRRRVAAVGGIRLDGGGRVRDLPGADAARRAVQGMRRARRPRPRRSACRIRPSRRSAWVAYNCSTSRSRSRSPCVMRARCARSIAGSAGASGGAPPLHPRAHIDSNAARLSRKLRHRLPPGGSSSPFARRVWHGGVQARVNGGRSTVPMVKTVPSRNRRYPDGTQPAVPLPAPPQLAKSTAWKIAVRAAVWPQTGRNMAEKSRSPERRVSGDLPAGTVAATARSLTMIKKSLPFGFHRLAKPIG